MKKLTKLLSLALAILMVMSLAGAAFAETPAADTTLPQTTIKLTGAPAGSEFTFYKLCDVSLDGTIYTYTVNSTYSNALQEALGVTSDADVIAALHYMTSENARIFADKLYPMIRSLSNDTAEANADGVASFKNDSGYYLIAQTTGGTGTPTAYSLVMLDTGVGAEKPVSVKVDLPTSFKKLKEVNDTRKSTSDWQDGADHDINDSIDFLISGSVSDYVTGYEGKYTMILHDKACDGLTFAGASAITGVRVVHNDTHTPKEQKVVSGYEVVTGDATKDGCTFHVVFNDVKNLSGESGKIEMHGGEKIQVEYKMKLEGENVVIGSAGNPNESWMTFSNNPYAEDSTDDTPRDKVKVFTYKMIVNKVDDRNQPLTGAEFQLYKLIQSDAADPGDSTQTVYTAEAKDGLKSGTVNGTTKAVEFTWVGLDAGIYKLVEETVPEGYNKMDDVFFKIETTFDTNEVDPGLATFSVTVLDSTMQAVDFTVPGNADKYANMTADKASGTITTTIVNKSGTLLPSTGGIGTTLFYVFGSVLAIGAGVLLISKKRMGAAD